MAIITTEAIVLRRIEHSETSLICTFYTKDFGLVPAIAKGARRQKSAFAGLLDLMSYLRIVVYTKETREVQTLSDAEYIKPFNRLRQDIERSNPGMVIIETVRKAIIGEEPHPEVFQLVIDTLSVLDRMPEPGFEIIWWFHLHLAALLGFAPQLEHCVHCDESLKAGTFSADTGQIVCDNCVNHQSGMVKLRPMDLRVLRYLLKTPLPEVDFSAIKRVSPQGDSGMSTDLLHPGKITGTVLRYLQYHIEGIGELQSVKFFATFNLPL